MSELMTPIPFRHLMTWIITEYAGTAPSSASTSPIRPAARACPSSGRPSKPPSAPPPAPTPSWPRTSSPAISAGARFFELKTVQKMDGADLAACINRPCILAEDECYNCEWSTELTVPQAFDEYVKAWCALKIISKVYGLGDPDGFVFNMSVGYDLEGIQGEKVNTYHRRHDGRLAVPPSSRSASRF